MKCLFPCFACLLLIDAYSPPSQPQTVATAAEQPGDAPVSPCDDAFNQFLEDTLFTSTASEFELLHEAGTYLVKKLKFTGGLFGITANPGFFIATYQTDSSGNWRRGFCGDMEGGVAYQFIMPDANFDGHKDLLIDVTSGGTFGHFTVGFLYDPQRQTFRRDTALDLSNLTIDVPNKQLRSRHYSSMYGGNVKSLYGLAGRLTCVARRSHLSCRYRGLRHNLAEKKAKRRNDEAGLDHGQNGPALGYFCPKMCLERRLEH